jgi:hypothetical protein
VRAPEFFQVLETHARFCPEGRVSLQEVIDLARKAIRFARDNGSNSSWPV